MVKRFFDPNFAAWYREKFERERSDARLGPHEGKIVEMLLAGIKPVGEISEQSPMEDLSPLLKAVKRGQLVAGRKLKNMNTGSWDCFFCQPGQEENMNEAIDMIIKARFERAPADEAYHRRLGQIFGYTEDEIETFLKHLKKIQDATLVSAPRLEIS